MLFSRYFIKKIVSTNDKNGEWINRILCWTTQLKFNDKHRVGYKADIFCFH